MTTAHVHPQGKTRARISKDKENVRNPHANVVKKTIPEDVVIADDSAETKKRKVTASSDKSEKPLKRITKRNTAAPAPGPTQTKQVSEAAAAEAAHASVQRHRANTTSRVKTFSLEEVSKITDMDDEFDEDDMPEVQMPPPSRAAPKPTTKARAAPKPAEAPKPTIVEKATVASKVASRAPRKPSAPSEAVGQHFDADDADTKSYLDLLESYNALQKKYTQMKNNKLDEAQAHTESVDKNIKDHAKGTRQGRTARCSLSVFCLGSLACGHRLTQYRPRDVFMRMHAMRVLSTRCSPIPHSSTRRAR